MHEAVAFTRCAGLNGEGSVSLSRGHMAVGEQNRPSWTSKLEDSAP